MWRICYGYSNKRAGGDEEDVCEDSGPMYSYDYTCLSPEGCFIKEDDQLN